MKKQTRIILRKISQYCIYLTILLLPVVFLPFTADFFEFNKTVLISALSMIGLITWTFSLDPKEEVSLWKSKFGKPVSYILISILLSLLISKSFLTSIIGFSGTLSNSIYIVVTLLIFGFVAKNVLVGRQSISKALWFLILGGVLTSIITILHYFGVYIFKFISDLEFTQYRRFTSIGYDMVQPFYLLALIPFSILLANDQKTRLPKIISIIFSLIILYGLVLASGKFTIWPGYITMTIATIIIFLSTGIIKSKKKLSPFIFLLPFLLFVLIHNVPAIENNIINTKDPLTSQPRLSLQDSWKTLSNQYSDSIKELLIGSGPDTYSYTFSKYKPASYVSSENSTIRFSRSSTQIFDIASNFGIIGIITWIYLIYISITFLKKIITTKHSSEYENILRIFGLSTILILISSFFVFFTSPMWIALIFSISISSTLYILHFPREAERTVLSLVLSKESLTIKKSNLAHFLPKSISLLVLLAIALPTVRLYAGEVFYKKAEIVANEEVENDEQRIENFTLANNYLNRAIEYFKYRDDYYSDKGIVDMSFLRRTIEINADDDNLTRRQEELKTMSIDAVTSAIVTEPNNIRNYKAAIYVYEMLVQITEGDYGDEYLGSINSALLLDPNSPELHHKKGVLLFLVGRNGAVEEIERALQLDPLYIQGYFDLAAIYHVNKMYDEAVTELNKIITILDNYGLQDLDIYDDLKQEIKDYESGNIPEKYQIGPFEYTVEN